MAHSPEVGAEFILAEEHLTALRSRLLERQRQCDVQELPEDWIAYGALARKLGDVLDSMNGLLQPRLGTDATSDMAGGHAQDLPTAPDSAHSA